MSRIRLVLFDAFDTLITPRLPIHVQYAQEAIKHGLPSITPESVREAFKPSFKKTNAQYPQWGRPTMTPSEWWMVCIEETMRTAGAEEDKLQQVMPRLGKALLDRFESAEGYRVFDDVLPCRKCYFFHLYVCLRDTQSIDSGKLALRLDWYPTQTTESVSTSHASINVADHDL